MTAVDRLAQIEGRANAATEGPWDKWGYHVVHDCGHCTCGAGGTSYGHESGCGAEQIGQASEPDAEFIAAARTDVPDLVAALRAVLDLHREARNDVDRTPPCPHCHGEPGIHECGCWADEKWPTVCAVCMEGTKSVSVEYPCPTVRAITEALIESREQ